jgi:hypothetical protein
MERQRGRLGTCNSLVAAFEGKSAIQEYAGARSAGGFIWTPRVSEGTAERALPFAAYDAKIADVQIVSNSHPSQIAGAKNKPKGSNAFARNARARRRCCSA